MKTKVLISDVTTPKTDIAERVDVVSWKPPTPEHLKEIEKKQGVIYNFIEHPEGVNNEATGKAFLKGYLLGAQLWESHYMVLELIPKCIDRDDVVRQIMEVRLASLREPIKPFLFGKGIIA